ncbi:hypothetical protein MPER_06151 [Moniliophthora perniciosa FA553]|nr:hypothetical protein MPER_06151 [Moniliophthora perniciosa FA553]
MSSIPQTTKAIVVRESADTSEETYHGAVLEIRPLSKLKEGEILVKMGAVAFNHRDVDLCTLGDAS